MKVIYVDYMENIWEFFVNSTGDLCYRIMYNNGKWTKDNFLDRNIENFDVYVDFDYELHIVYSTSSGKIKYCTMQNKKWFGREIYEEGNNEDTIKNLKISILNGIMHIVYLKTDNSREDHGILMDCIWDGSFVVNNSIQDIMLCNDKINKYFEIILNDKLLDLYFLTDEGYELSLNKVTFEEDKWNNKKRLYGIDGEKISFEVLMENNITHIVNRTKENNMNILEHIIFDSTIKDYKVFESKNEINKPILFIKNRKLYCSFIEGDKIYYSSFFYNGWSVPVPYEIENENPIEEYKCYIYNEIGESITSNRVYVTEAKDFTVYVPKDFEINSKLEENINNNENIEEINKLKGEILKERTKRIKLEEKYRIINLQMEKKQQYLENYEERLSIISEEKRKIDENYNSLIINHRNEIVELKQIIKSYEAEKLELSNEKNRLLTELEMEKNQSLVNRILRRKVEL